jgi:hypothetical protein
MNYCEQVFMPLCKVAVKIVRSALKLKLLEFLSKILQCKVLSHSIYPLSTSLMHIEGRSDIQTDCAILIDTW